MTPALHTPAVPQVPGCERGHAPKRYPAGRVCVACPTVLRRTNPGPWCDPCLDNDHVAAPRRGAVAARRPHKPEIAGSNPAAATNHSGPPASACSEAAPTAAPAAREQKGEATVPRDEIHNRCEDVLEIMRGGKWWTAAELGERLGVSRQRVHTMIKQLREAGHTIESQAGIGTRLVKEKLRTHSGEGEKSATPPSVTPGTRTDDAAEDAQPAPATPPASAPVIPPPEQPANVAPASEPLPPQGGPAPFAGIDIRTSLAATTWIDPDDEIEVLEICVLQLGRLERPARDRVMTYLASRFMVEW